MNTDKKYEVTRVVVDGARIGGGDGLVVGTCVNTSGQNGGEGGRLGVQLFERYHKRISLTPAGAVFLRRGEDILNRVDSAIKEMEDFADLRRDVIQINITPMLGAVIFPYVLSKFRADHPALELIVVEERLSDLEFP